MTNTSATTLIDIDALRQERGQGENITFKLGGKTTVLPPVLPLSTYAAYIAAVRPEGLDITGSDDDDDAGDSPEGEGDDETVKVGSLTIANYGLAVHAVVKDLTRLGFKADPLEQLGMTEWQEVTAPWFNIKATDTDETKAAKAKAAAGKPPVS